MKDLAMSVITLGLGLVIGEYVSKKFLGLS